MKQVERDAQEFGRHLRQGGWRLGLLVARNVEKAPNGVRRGSDFSRNQNGKVNATEFAQMAGLKTTAARVLRHLKAWEKAAAEGVVPKAADLKPTSEPDLDVEKLPVWGDFYDATDAGGRPRDSKPADAVTILSRLDPEVRAATIAEALDSPTAKAELAAELLSDDKVIDAAYNDDQTALQIHRGSARLHSKDVQRDDDRQRIQNNLTEDEQRWAKFQRHIRAGEFGLAEGQEKKFEVTDERSEWLRERADFYRYISRWLEAIAAHEEVTDDALQRFLNG